MARNLAEMAEMQMRRAEALGQLRGLSGEGEPLPKRPLGTVIGRGNSVGDRIKAEIGGLPRATQLKKELAKAKAAYAEAVGADAKKAAMARIAELEMRLSIEEDARRSFMGT